MRPRQRWLAHPISLGCKDDWLVYLTDDPQLEIALWRAYNRFVADGCAKAPKRLKWMAIPPLRAVDSTLEELAWAKEHGAAGIFFFVAWRQSHAG